MNDYVVQLNDSKINVVLANGSGKITADSSQYAYELIHLDDKKYLLKLNNKFFEINCREIKDGNLSVYINGKEFVTSVKSALSEKASRLLQQKHPQRHKTEVKAPMPGMILKIKKHQDEKVAQGETVIILEAMKMENDLRAPHPGVIGEIFVNEGSAIEKGTVLFTIV